LDSGVGLFEEVVVFVPGVLGVVVFDVLLGPVLLGLESLDDLGSTLDLDHEAEYLQVGLGDLEELVFDDPADLGVDLALDGVHEVLEAVHLLVEVLGVHPDQLEVRNQVDNGLLEVLELHILERVRVDG